MMKQFFRRLRYFFQSNIKQSWTKQQADTLGSLKFLDGYNNNFSYRLSNDQAHIVTRDNTTHYITKESRFVYHTNTTPPIQREVYTYTVVSCYNFSILGKKKYSTKHFYKFNECLEFVFDEKFIEELYINDIQIINEVKKVVNIPQHLLDEYEHLLDADDLGLI